MSAEAMVPETGDEEACILCVALCPALITNRITSLGSGSDYDNCNDSNQHDSGNRTHHIHPLVTYHDRNCMLSSVLDSKHATNIVLPNIIPDYVPAADHEPCFQSVSFVKDFQFKWPSRINSYLDTSTAASGGTQTLNLGINPDVIQP